MPTYAYACTACAHRFDAVQSFSDPSLTECPECQGRLRKQYGSIGVTFNGSGFYRTDSRAGAGKGGSKNESKGSKSDAKGSGESSSGSSESKSGGSGSGSTSSTSEAKSSPAPSGS